jgi:hypothetical protein
MISPSECNCHVSGGGGRGDENEPQLVRDGGNSEGLLRGCQYAGGACRLDYLLIGMVGWRR